MGYSIFRNSCFCAGICEVPPRRGHHGSARQDRKSRRRPKKATSRSKHERLEHPKAEDSEKPGERACVGSFLTDEPDPLPALSDSLNYYLSSHPRVRCAIVVVRSSGRECMREGLP